MKKETGDRRWKMVDSKVWNLEPGTWNARGARSMELGTWNLERERSELY